MPPRNEAVIRAALAASVLLLGTPDSIHAYLIDQSWSAYRAQQR